MLNSRGGVAGGGDSDGGEGDNGVGGRGRDGERQNGGWRYRHGRFGSGSRPPWSGMTLRQWQALIMAASQNATARCATAGRRERRGSTAIAIDMSLCAVPGVVVVFIGQTGRAPPCSQCHNHGHTRTCMQHGSTCHDSIVVVLIGVVSRYWAGVNLPGPSTVAGQCTMRTVADP